MSAVAFELGETILIDTERQTKLVIVSELLDELRDTKKRLVELEKFRERYFQATGAPRSGRRSFPNSSELAARTVGLDCVGRPGDAVATSVLADGGEEDLLAEQEGEFDDAVVHAAVASAREHQLFAITGDCT